MNNILIYGATGFLGREISKLAKQNGLNPVIAGRNGQTINKLASELQLDHLVFSINEIENYISEFDILMNCAGPYIDTYEPLVKACIKHNTHYLDLSGEIPVYEAINKLGEEDQSDSSAMLLPGIGFDVAVTDCLALLLKEHLPTGSDLLLAFKSDGPAGLPPGTLKTMVSLIPFGNWIRKEGKMVQPINGIETKRIAFTEKPDKTIRITWGDIYTAYFTTGIPNIHVFASFPKTTMFQLKFIDMFRRVLSKPRILRFMRKTLKGGSTKQQRDKTRMLVYGQLTDSNGNKVDCRIEGPEGGFIWTSRLAVEALLRIQSGIHKPSYQTPGSAFGSSFASCIEGVNISEVEYKSNNRKNDAF